MEIIETYIDDTVIVTDVLPETMQLTELSLKAFKHVFIARPDGLNMEQMRYLKKLAEESGVVLHLGTGYKFCPAYKMFAKTEQPKIIEVKQQLVKTGDLLTKLNIELCYVFDFLTSILNVNITKYDVREWNNSENLPDLLNCRLECSNGCVINMLSCTIDAGKPKLEITFISSETVITADIFKSSVRKQFRANDYEENIVIDDYCEKTVNDCYFENFKRAKNNDLLAIRSIDKQFQNFITANSIINLIYKK